jgi:hypothetical protein
MKQTINRSQFIDAFMSWETYKDNFSYAGLVALYDYLTDMEDGMDDEIELDVVALCVEYTEYPSAWEAMEQYQPEDMPTVEDTGVDAEGRGMDLVELAEAQEKLALEWLEGRTTVIQFDNNTVDGRGVIIRDF